MYIRWHGKCVNTEDIIFNGFILISSKQKLVLEELICNIAAAILLKILLHH